MARQRNRRRSARAAAVVAALLVIAGLAGARGMDELVPLERASIAGCAGPTWVAAWATSPADTSADRPATVERSGDQDAVRSFVDQTLRMVLTPGTGGSRARVELSNRFGTAPVIIGRAALADRRTGPSIDGATARSLTFDDEVTVTIPPGETVVSDPVEHRVVAHEDLAVDLYVAGESPLDVHPFALQTSYVTPAGAGDRTREVSGDSFTSTTASWLTVTGVEVLVDRAPGVVVVLGDSITAGVGTTPGAAQRWPDHLARRLGDQGRGPFVVINAGIGGNQLTRDNIAAEDGTGWGIGEAATTRFASDVESTAGVTDVIVFIGINDLYAPSSPDPVGALVDGYRDVVDRARDAGLRVIGVTITPGSLPDDSEEQRQEVNRWIRSSGAFDAVVDADAVVRDPDHPEHLAPGLGIDPVHLGDLGAETLASAVDPQALRGATCR